MKKIIETTRAWTCENLDLLSPIDKEGLLVLFEDDSTEFMPYDDIKKFEWASPEAKHKFYLQNGYLQPGDEVVVVKGRTLPIGSVHIVDGFYTYEVPGTYGHKSSKYVVFKDGTKINILNILPNIEGLEADIICREFTGYILRGGRL